MISLNIRSSANRLDGPKEEWDFEATKVKEQSKYRMAVFFTSLSELTFFQ